MAKFMLNIQTTIEGENVREALEAAWYTALYGFAEAGANIHIGPTYDLPPPAPLSNSTVMEDGDEWS